MKLSQIVVSDAVRGQLKAQTREEAIEELVGALAEAGAVTKKKVPEIIQAVLKRESQATTGIGKGVALPHAKLAGIKKPLAAIGNCSEGLDFNSLDAKPVYSVILLLSSPDHPDEHLEAMETIFRHIQRDIFRKFLRQAQNAEDILELLKEADAEGPSAD